MWLEWDGKNAKTPAAQGWFAKNREAAGIVSRQSAPCVLLCALLWDSLEPQSGLLCCWLWSAASRPPNGRCRHGHVDLICFAAQLYHSACRAAVLLCYLVACRMVFLPGFDALPATYPPPARRLSPQSGMACPGAGCDGIRQAWPPSAACRQRGWAWLLRQCGVQTPPPAPDAWPQLA